MIKLRIDDVDYKKSFPCFCGFMLVILLFLALADLIPYPIDYFEKTELNCPYTKNTQACVEWDFKAQNPTFTAVIIRMKKEHQYLSLSI